MLMKDKYEDFWFIMFSLTDYMRDKFISSPDIKYLNKFRDLTNRQLKIVRQVMYMQEHYPEGITLKTLAQRDCTSAAAASEMVDVLVKKGIFIRTQSSTDRRSIQIKLSDGMMQELDKVKKFMTRKIKHMLKDVCNDDLELILSVFERIYLKIQG